MWEFSSRIKQINCTFICLIWNIFEYIALLLLCATLYSTYHTFRCNTCHAKLFSWAPTQSYIIHSLIATEEE